MTFAVAALLAGIAAGLRCMTPMAVISVAALRGDVQVAGTPFAFIQRTWWTVIACAFAVGELVVDKLPIVGSRKRRGPFMARVVVGAGCGAALGASHGMALPGALCGAIGGVLGTLGGYAGRRRLALALGRDFPAALIEDVVAISLAVTAVCLAR